MKNIPLCRISFFPGADVLRTIVTTCAQIIAGLYGITAAGYTFFLSRIDALSAQDMTLDYIVASLKNRYKRLMWYITGGLAKAGNLILAPTEKAMRESLLRIYGDVKLSLSQINDDNAAVRGASALVW